MSLSHVAHGSKRRSSVLAPRATNTGQPPRTPFVARNVNEPASKRTFPTSSCKAPSATNFSTGQIREKSPGTSTTFREFFFFHLNVPLQCRLTGSQLLHHRHTVTISAKRCVARATSGCRELSSKRKAIEDASLKSLMVDAPLLIRYIHLCVTGTQRSSVVIFAIVCRCDTASSDGKRKVFQGRRRP